MGKNKIIEKLETLLKKQPFTAECQVLYLMVEVRKILDHAYDKKTGFTLLRFYCDWLVHTDKRYNLEHITPIIQRLFQTTKNHIETNIVAENEMVDFLYMKELNQELFQFLSNEQLPTDLCTDKEYWSCFVKLMIEILSEQPIIFPAGSAASVSSDVSMFVFNVEGPGKIKGTIHFKIPISGYDHYNFGNTY